LIEARGAPYAQGWQQGALLAPCLRAEVARARAELGRIRWWRATRRAHRGPGRIARRFLPQHHERLAGIAEGAGVRLSALELLDTRHRVEARVGLTREGVEVALLLPRFLEEAPILRRTFPDAGGFASLEIAGAASAGCVAGTNTEGIAVICERDRGPDSPSACVLAQEVLLRTSALGAGVDHALRRGSYVGGAWSLVLVDPSGAPARVEQDASGVRVTEALGPGLPLPSSEPRILISGAEGRLRVWAGKGSESCDPILDATLEQKRERPAG
jgi:hypothetical protein